jgi:hypothetical protein
MTVPVIVIMGALFLFWRFNAHKKMQGWLEERRKKKEVTSATPAVTLAKKGEDKKEMSVQEMSLRCATLIGVAHLLLYLAAGSEWYWSHLWNWRVVAVQVALVAVYWNLPKGKAPLHQSFAGKLKIPALIILLLLVVGGGGSIKRDSATTGSSGWLEKWLMSQPTTCTPPLGRTSCSFDLVVDKNHSPEVFLEPATFYQYETDKRVGRRIDDGPVEVLEPVKIGEAPKKVSIREKVRFSPLNENDVATVNFILRKQ